MNIHTRPATAHCGLITSRICREESDTPQETGPKTPTTIAEVLHGIEPMEDLRQFAIDDLAPEDEDEYFRVLENA